MVLTVWIESFCQPMKEISNHACVGINVTPHVLASLLDVDRPQPMAFDRLMSRIRNKAASCDDLLRYVLALPFLSNGYLNIVILSYMFSLMPFLKFSSTSRR